MDPSCCNVHIGAEYGGGLDKSSFSASTELNRNARSEAGRLNAPNKLVQINDINVKNDMTGGWLPSESDKSPHWECSFIETGKDKKVPFLAEVKGVVTQGLDGFHGNDDAKRWTKTYNVKYENPAGDMTYIGNQDGSPVLFTANYDKNTAVTNTFPYPVLTKRVQILPISWRGKTAALRAEFIGCKTGCIKSLGVCQDALVNGEPPINTISDGQMTSSSQQPGNHAFRGRISYQHQRDSGILRDKKTWQPYSQSKTWEAGQQSCATQLGGVGVLGTISDEQENDRLINQLRNEDVPADACWWIGLHRTGGVYLWDDGSALTFENWLQEDDQKNPCACISVKDNYKWMSRDCTISHPYICQRSETGHVWKAMTSTTEQWLQVDLGQIMKINGILTQGAPEQDEWVSSYQMQFSDTNRQYEWYTYMDPKGPVNFIGNTDRYTIVEGMLRQPITARYIKINPRTWFTKIAMRIDIIGCNANERVDCYDDGNAFAQHGDSFSIDCPAGCDKVTPWHVWGTHKYKLQSSVCQAAIHDGKVAGQNGGSARV